MIDNKVRVMRIVIYEGSREWVETTVARAIHGRMTMTNGCSITGVTLNEFPEVIERDSFPVAKLYPRYAPKKARGKV